MFLFLKLRKKRVMKKRAHTKIEENMKLRKISSRLKENVMRILHILGRPFDA